MAGESGRRPSVVAILVFRWKKAPGEWVHSVAAPHELPALLARIYLIEME
ncbi:hypothetical protein ACLB1S_20590 [Escherichia coli]